MPIQIAIVGLEFGAKVLLPAFRRDTRCMVAALCGASLDKAARVGKACGVGRVYGDWRKMLNEVALDALVISTPPGIQVVIAEQALRQNLAVFAEKPLGVTAQDTQRLCELSVGKTTMVDFEFVELDVWRRALPLVEKLRRPVKLDVVWRVMTYAARHHTRNWKSEVSLGGGALHVFGSHVLYNLEWFLGKITQLSSKLTKSDADPRETHTGVTLNVEFRDGGRARIAIDTCFEGEPEHVWNFNDEVVVENRGKDYMGHWRLLHNQQCVATTELSGEDARIAVVSKMASRFLDAVISRQGTAIDFAAGHRVQNLIEAALESDKKG